MKRSSLALVAVTLLAVVGISLYSQGQSQNQAPRPARSRADETLDRWNDIGNKLIAMAQDFPEDKYDYKLQKDQRTFALNLLHAAAFEYVVARAVSGSNIGPDFGQEAHNPSREVYKTKADVVKLVDVDEPRDPGPGHVLIRVILFPIHWGDLQAIQRGSPSGKVRAGVEATGIVEKVGPGVHHVTPGARVSVFQPGAWAERITADAQFVVPVPDTASDLTYRGKRLQVVFTVEDEGVFTMPWSGAITYERPAMAWEENVCAENPFDFFAGKNDAFVPTADKADF